jgi:acetate kinase
MNNSEMSFEFYNGKSLASLCKDIVSNSQSKRDQLDIMIAEIREKINTVNDATVLAPIVKSMLDTSVKNDELLVKLAAIGQRIVSTKASLNAIDNKPGNISNEELKYLQSALENLDDESVSPIHIVSKSDD